MSAEDALGIQRMQDLKNSLGIPATVASAETVRQHAATAVPPAPSPTELSQTGRLGEKLRTVVRIAKTPIALGLLTFLILLVLLLTSKPSFFGSEIVDEKGAASKRANVKFCFLFAAFCGGAVVVVPHLIRWYSGKNVAATAG